MMMTMQNKQSREREGEVDRKKSSAKEKLQRWMGETGLGETAATCVQALKLRSGKCPVNSLAPGRGCLARK